MKAWEKIAAVAVAAVAVVLLIYTISGTGAWEGFKDVVIQAIDFKALSNMLFNEYGALLLVLGALMFGAIIAGVTISKEEDDTDDTN